MEWKDRIESAQALVSIAAIVIGGWWTYDNFIRERRHVPHANIEHIISDIDLKSDARLLRVSMVVTNTGTAKMVIKKVIARVQKITPINCVKKERCITAEIDEALKETDTTHDRFEWPTIAQRKIDVIEKLEIEPGEKHQLDFEFAILQKINVIRVYTYIRNESASDNGAEIGWNMSTYYTFPNSKKGAS